MTQYVLMKCKSKEAARGFVFLPYGWRKHLPVERMRAAIILTEEEVAKVEQVLNINMSELINIPVKESDK